MSGDLLQTKIGFCESAFKSRVFESTVRRAVDAIRSNAHKAIIDQLREAVAAGLPDTQQKAIKTRLAAYLWSGTFSERKAKKLVQHSGLLCLDLDSADNPVIDRSAVEADPHAAIVFESPRGGLKVVCRVNASCESSHKGCFAAAERHFWQVHGLRVDQSGKDVCRLCFASHDPALYLNVDAVAFDPIEENRASDRLPERSLARHAERPPMTAQQVAELLRWIPSRPHYDEWLRVVSGVVDHLGEAEAIPLLQSWSPEEQPGEYVEKARHRLKEVTLGTVVELARQRGWMPSPPRGAAVAAESNPVAFALTPRALLEYGRHDRDIPEVGTYIENRAAESESGLAMMFSFAMRGRYLFDHTAKKWMHYDGTRWLLDEVGSARITLQGVCRTAFHAQLKRIGKQIAAAVESGEIKPGDTKNPLEQKRAEMLKALAWLNRRATLDNALHLARDHLAGNTADFDANPLLLNVRNGVLQLSSGGMAGHDPKHLCRKLANCSFDPLARCPRWAAFVATICCGDESLAKYLQKLLGTTLSGRVDFDFFALTIGGGSNGKSTLANVVIEVLGDYAAQIPATLLMVNGPHRDSAADYETCLLQGVRFAVASELPPGQRLNEQKVKDLCGGDKELMARRPYGEPFGFKPSHKLFALGNSAPTVQGGDDGIWRRIKLIPMHHRFPAPGESGNRARSEVEAELLAERDGILQWLFEGYKLADTEGLVPPSIVQAATAEYRHDGDVLGAFIEEHCQIDGHLSCTFTEMHNAVQQFCRDRRRREVTPMDIRTRFETMGIRHKKVQGVRFYEGIKLCKNS
jgi:P4 family phage/plasmid primase-like protien